MAQVITAPSQSNSPSSRQSVFLAGPTTGRDWRRGIIAALANLPITIFDPRREDWDSTWQESFDDPRWAEQVEWELEKQDAADIVVLLFGSQTSAPVSLLELGLAARSRKAIVCAVEGYSKAGNAEAVCRRYKLPFVRTEEELLRALIERLKACRTE